MKSYMDLIKKNEKQVENIQIPQCHNDTTIKVIL